MRSLNWIGLSAVVCCVLVGSVSRGQVPAGETSLSPKISDEAREIHATSMLFDGHNDLPWTMRQKAGSSFDKIDIAEATDFHTDIPRLRAGGVKAQFWSVYVPAGTDLTGNALLQTLEQIQLVHDMCERYPNEFEMAQTADDIQRIVGAGKIASMIGVEGGHSIQNSLQVLRELYDRGARYMTLTHSKTLAWADSCTDVAKNNGLSPFGKEVVREMNRLGMLVDLSHVSPKCMKDALEVSVAPVIYSHSSAKAICDHPRNVPDEMLKMTAKNGGVVMVNFYSGFVVPQEDVEKNKQARGDCDLVCDHIDHIVKVAGIDHVGIGADYDGVGRLPRNLEDVSCYPNITQELLDRGYTRGDIHKVLGENVLRVLRQTEQVATQLKARPAPISASELFELEVGPSPVDRKNVIVRHLVSLPNYLGEVVTLSDSTGNQYLGQVSAPSIGLQKEAKEFERMVTFVLPELKANTTLKLKATSDGLTANRVFQWHDDEYGTAELQYADQPVMKYMYEPVDDSTPERRGETYKVFHHVYSPDGQQLVTKGPGGLFPHHRGLFYGFNRISYGDKKKADVWHCRNGESQTHQKMVRKISGPVFGSQLAVIYWHGQDGKPFAHELREMTAFRINGGTLIEFDSILESEVGPVKLDGDPQHAGFQFRASQAVPDKTKNLTFYIRPDGKGEPGKFRNWSAKKGESEINKSHVNLPWNALNFTIGDDNFTCCYLDHPDNPKESRFSERDYGRFGSYFEYQMDDGKPLKLQYRIWLQEGEMKVDEIETMSQQFIDPVKVK